MDSVIFQKIFVSKAFYRPKIQQLRFLCVYDILLSIFLFFGGIQVKTAEICMLIVIIAYLAAMVIIGAVYSKKNKSSDDFFLGGRKLGPLVTAMSADRYIS